MFVKRDSALNFCNEKAARKMLVKLTPGMQNKKNLLHYYFGFWDFVYFFNEKYESIFH
jgi:hypothetical protein